MRFTAEVIGRLGVTSALTGAALYVSPGAIDRLATESSPSLRVGLLPPLWVLPVAIAIAAIVIAAFVRLLAGVGLNRVDQRPADEAIVPLAWSAVLVLPWIPYVADVLPATVMLTGPAKWIVWGVAVSCTIVAAFRDRLPDLARGVSSRTGLAVVFVTTALVSGGVAYRFTHTPLVPGGDEPHYLIIAQSLWRDGDLRIENNHQRGDYREYFANPLAPHYLTRGVDGEIYSVHPIGLPIMIAPVYAAGGYPAVVATIVVLGATAAALAWRAARLVAGTGPATFAWIACAFTAPFLFNGFLVYPEVPAAAAVTAALVASWTATRPGSLTRWLGVGLLLGALPWLSTKYAPMSFAALLVAAGRAWWPAHAIGEQSGPSTAGAPPSAAVRARALLAIGVPYAVSVLLWLAFFQWIWGTWSPAAPYGVQRETRLQYLPAGAPGLLFDQEYGIVASAPVLWMGLAGLVAMLCRGGATGRLALEIAAVGGALLCTVGAFHIWWGGSAPAGRPVTSGILLLTIPVAWRFADRRHAGGVRSAHLVALVVSLAIALTLASAQRGLLVAAARSGASRLFGWLSPTWPTWGALPSFLVQRPDIALAITVVWLALVTVAVWWLARRTTGHGPGRTTRNALVAMTLVGCAASAFVPRAFAKWSPPPPDLNARPSVRLLDAYDRTRLPLAVAYDPVRRVSPRDLPRLVELTAEAGDERARPPVPLLHDARWDLPAGRYLVEIERPADRGAGGALGLQLGRTGEPVAWWPSPEAGIPWRQYFDLPIDVGFVGLRPSPDFEAAGTRVRLRPLAIVDAHTRLPALEVLGATTMHGVTVFRHDDGVWLEPGGFWTQGRASTAVTIASGSPGRVVLRLHAGAARNTIRIDGADNADPIALEPGRSAEVTLHARQPAVWRLRIRTTAGFVPAALDPTNGDTRMLGCRIEPHLIQ